MRHWQLPRIDPRDRWIGGVAAAIAREIGVQPILIRVAFAILALAGGWGLAVYGAAWAVLAVAQPRQDAPYRPSPKATSAFHRYLGVSMIVIGALLMLRNLVPGFIDQLVFPAGFLIVGILVAWTRHGDEVGSSTVVRVVAGAAIGLGGLIAFIFLSASLLDAVLVFLIGLAVVTGLAVVAAPSLARIGRDLDAERQNRVRADERARISAHLHDSVLQTLALIQRHADDPTRTAQLARQQERELRQWLYGATSTATEVQTRLGPALESMAADVDADHGTPVKVIVVNDGEVDPARLDALVAAAREAVVNAAKHSGARQVDVYAERSPRTVEVFVRDNGVGFDPTETGADRRGIAESIRGRMERSGGSAEIWSTVGEGTEVELTMPVDEPATSKEPA